MGKANKIPVRMIDVAGGTLVAACVCIAAWLLLFTGDRVGAEVGRLNRLIRAAQRETRSIQAAQAEQSVLFDANQKELAETGQLPHQAPIEEYFQALSSYADDHGIRVIRLRPLAARRYPGLLEQRFTYEIAGSTAGLIRFLKAIEDSDFWADVGYLKIETVTAGHRTATRTRQNAPEPDETRSAALTISVFSAPAAEQQPAEGDST